MSMVGRGKDTPTRYNRGFNSAAGPGIAAEDVLQTAAHHLEAELRRRPVDLGATLMAFQSVSAFVKKSISTASSMNMDWQCPDAAARLLPTVVGFLQYCHNSTQLHLRTLELHAINLCYYLIVPVSPIGKVDPLVQQTFRLSLTFFLQCARLQLQSVQSGAVRHDGAAPSIWDLPSANLSSNDMLLTECDGYLWLSAALLIKLEVGVIMEWLEDLLEEPHCEPFVAAAVIAACECLSFLLNRYSTQYCRPLLELHSEQRSHQYASPAFPLPALRVVPEPPLPKLQFRLPNSFHWTLLKTTQLLVELSPLIGRCGHFSIVLVLERLLSMRVWVGVFEELATDAGTPDWSPRTAESTRPSNSMPRQTSNSSFVLQQKDSVEPSSTPMQCEELLVRLGELILNLHLQMEPAAGGTWKNAVAVSKRQLLRCAILTLLRGGLREDNHRIVPVTASAWARATFDSLGVADNVMEPILALALDELLQLKAICEKAYGKRINLAHALASLRDFLFDMYSHGADGDSLDSESPKPTPLRGPVGASNLNPFTVNGNGWRALVRVPILLLEYEASGDAVGPDGGLMPSAEPLDALWRLSMYYLKLQADQDDVPFVDPPPGDAASVHRTIAELDWEDYEDIDDAAVTTWSRLRLPPTLNAALRVLNLLVVACLQRAEFAAAASYCDAFGSLLSHKEITSTVSASLFLGSARLYALCGLHEEALRVGLIASRQLSTLSCDLITYAEAVEVLRRSAELC